MAGQVMVEVHVEGSCHRLLAFRCRQLELDPDPEGAQDCECLFELAGRLAMLQVDDEAEPCP